MELPLNVHLQHVYIHHLQEYLDVELSVCTWYKRPYGYTGSDDMTVSVFIKPTVCRTVKTTAINKRGLKGYFTQYVHNFAVVGGWGMLFPLKVRFIRHRWTVSKCLRMNELQLQWLAAIIECFYLDTWGRDEKLDRVDSFGFVGWALWKDRFLLKWRRMFRCLCFEESSNFQIHLRAWSITNGTLYLACH